MENGRITRDLGYPWYFVAALASVWLLVVFVLKQVIGPLNPDEVYFTHTLWLTLHGKRQFVDFYSQHFPAYFALYVLLLPRSSADNLQFVWAVRVSNLAVVGAYIAILFAAARRAAVFLLPLLLLMIVVSRMVEVRADTLGLLAFNGAWAILLAGRSRQSGLVAAVLALIAAAFSARALPMGVGFGVALMWRAIAIKDIKSLAGPFALLSCAGAAALTWYVADPSYVAAMLHSTLLSPSALLTHLSLGQRVAAFDRTPQIALALLATVIALTCMVRRLDIIRAGIVAIACLSQLLLIFLDPSPFPYVYAWAAVPTLLGLLLCQRLLPIDPRQWTVGLAAACATVLALAMLAYPLMSGRQPPVGSNYRLLPDATISRELIQGLPTDRLVSLMVSRDQQQSLSNQILVRSELCRRVKGTVLSAWQNHPICLADASYEWFSVKWPDIGDPAAPTTAWFATIFARHPPDLFIWKSGTGAPLKLNAATASLIRNYDLYPGFAINPRLRGATGNSGKAAIPQNNGRR